MRTTVGLFIFRRPDTTERVFQAIRAVRPQRLMVVADGPRNEEERILCSETRAVVERIDWQCELLTNFSDINLGNTVRFSSGLDWIFSRVEDAIIFEDDNLPDPSFFPFCQELLERYRNDSRIMMISGSNFQPPLRSKRYSYYFSRIPNIWGWATWRRAWQHYDPSAHLWHEFRDNNMLRAFFRDEDSHLYWRNFLENSCVKDNRLSFEGRWLFSILTQSGLCIVPNQNLVTNIGWQPGAISERHSHPFENHPHQPIALPLTHPPYIIQDIEADFNYQKTLYELLPKEIIWRMGQGNAP